MKKIFLITTCLLLLLNGTVKSDGLPGEFLLSDQWRAFFKYYSPMSNPAFMMEQQYSSLRGVISLSSDNVANLWETGIIVPVGYYQAMGLTVLGENGQAVVDAGESILLGDSAEFVKSRNNNYLFSLSYALNPVGRLCAGVNLKLIDQGNFGDPSFGFGADLGVSYRLLFHPFWGYHNIGLTFHNVLSTRTGVYEKNGHSSQIMGNYYASVLQDKIKFHLQTDITDFMSKADDFVRKKKMEWDIYLQAGVRVLPFLSVHGFTNYGDSREIDYWGFAGELNLPQVNGGRDLSFTYQYRNDLSSKLAGSHSLYFRSEVGKSREELAISRFAQTLNLSANELYNKALKFYYKGDYWNAYFTFIRLLVEYPDFYKNDYVTLHAGSCLEKMDMREESVKAYLELREKYPGSSVVPMGDLGLMRIFYRQGAYSGVNNYFAELNRPTISDSLKFHGCYLMGESLLRQSEYRSAMTYFEMIPDQHPDYIFAQHSIATIHAIMNSGYHLCSANLENCINANASTNEQREIANRSLVFLGYIYYEENTLSKAVTALRMVPQKSFYYEDALLGLGWTAIKAHQWADCIDAGLKLAQTSNKFVMQCEGALLQAYGHIVEKRYPQAQILLGAINARMKDFKVLSEDSLTTSKMKYESDRISYSFFAEKVNNMAKRGANTQKVQSDSLHQKQIRFKEKIDNYLVFADEYKRQSFFERSFFAVKEDVEYALATVEKIMSNPNRAKMLKEDKEISDEINKLKEEMERINTH